MTTYILASLAVARKCVDSATITPSVHSSQNYMHTMVESEWSQQYRSSSRLVVVAVLSVRGAIDPHMGGGGLSTVRDGRLPADVPALLLHGGDGIRIREL